MFARGAGGLLPRPATKEWGEDRGEGLSKEPLNLLAPALSSIGWRRGSVFGCGFAALRLSRLGGSFEATVWVCPRSAATWQKQKRAAVAGSPLENRTLISLQVFAALALSAP